MKNLLILVDDEYHNEVKSYVAKKGISLKKFITQLIDKEMNKEKEQAR